MTHPGCKYLNCANDWGGTHLLECGINIEQTKAKEDECGVLRFDMKSKWEIAWHDFSF